MSAILDCALELAQQKVRLFPVRPNSKLPAITNYAEKATSDSEELMQIFGQNKFNSGIACGKVSEGLYLVGFDIDFKGDKNGYDTLELMEELGEKFPETWSQKTPTGGEHRLFWSPVPIRQGAGICGRGLDLRGEGGYLVGPGSTINGNPYYVTHHIPIAQFPEWAIQKWQKLATVTTLTPNKKHIPLGDQVLALKQSVAYLQTLDMASSGSRSDSCFKAVAKLKDFGLDQSQVMDVLIAHWKCEPMLDDAELFFTINNAYRYSKNAPGVAAIDLIFKDENGEAKIEQKPKTPEEIFNPNHFYMAFAGNSRVYREGFDDSGKSILESWPVHVFHEKYGSKKIMNNGKMSYASKLWMESENRREYERKCFDPSGKTYKTTYNLWRGFQCKPLAVDEITTKDAQESVDLFLEHIEQNICSGNKKEAEWLLTYFAHIFQRPAVKPGVSVVFKGRKGTGKTIISEILNHLIGDNSVIVSDKAHVLGHFNSLMEDKLLITLDEAFWSGDKSVEGILKDTITGNTRVITHKGCEPYKANVYDRVIIIGNDDWLVPASEDERRYAVFNVSDKRRQDRSFFGKMKDGMFMRGGAELLMRFFLNYDLSKYDVSVAPHTSGLKDQKEQSLGVVPRWWFSCLEEENILGTGIQDWPKEISIRELYGGFINQLKIEGHKNYVPSKIAFVKDLRRVCKSAHRITKNDSGSTTRAFVLPMIEVARKEWDGYIGFEGEWD